MPCGEIIEEEERLCALDDQIIHAHGDQIDADIVMRIIINREFDLGAYAVVRCDKQWVLIASGFRVEKTAKSANLTVCAGTGCGLYQGADGLHQCIARSDRYAGGFICVIVGLSCFR